MYKIITFFALALCGILSTPFVTYAYFTTEQHAFSLNNQLGVFTIEYTFGHEDHDIYMPILALRNGAPRTDALSYQIYNTDDEVAKGIASGIALSGNAKIVDGMYMIPKGKSATFTFLGFFAPNPSEHNESFHAQIINLPFSFDNTQQLQLNKSELQYYTTPEVTLTKHSTGVK